MIFVLVSVFQKIMAKQLLRWRPLAWISNQTLRHEIPKVFWIAFINFWRVFSHYVIKYFCLLFFDVRGVPFSNLKSKNTIWPNINFLVVLFYKLDQFWSHPAEGANLADCASLLFRELSRIPKISQFDFTICINQYVITLDITMQNPSGMQEINPFKCLVQNILAHIFINLTSHILATLSDRPYVHEL